MTVRKSQRGRWMIDVHICMPDKSVKRVRKVSPVQTKRGAEQYEREVREAVLARTWGSKEGEQSAYSGALGQSDRWTWAAGPEHLGNGSEATSMSGWVDIFRSSC